MRSATAGSWPWARATAVAPVWTRTVSNAAAAAATGRARALAACRAGSRCCIAEPVPIVARMQHAAERLDVAAARHRPGRRQRARRAWRKSTGAARRRSTPCPGSGRSRQSASTRRTCRSASSVIVVCATVSSAETCTPWGVPGRRERDPHLRADLVVARLEDPELVAGLGEVVRQPRRAPRSASGSRRNLARPGSARPSRSRSMSRWRQTLSSSTGTSSESSSVPAEAGAAATSARLATASESRIRRMSSSHPNKPCQVW